MEPIRPPIELGAVNPQAPPAYARWGLLGRLAWWFNRPSKWAFYRESIKKQVAARGIVSREAWPSDEHFDIAIKIQEILAEVLWEDQLSFHPDDPWFVIGDWEMGDLSEVEVLVCIEQKLGLKFPKSIGKRIESGLTFGELVAFIEGNR